MRFAVSTALLACLALPVAALADDLQPGLYTMTATTDLAGDKPSTETKCITKKDIDSGLTQLGIQKESGCKVADFKRGPNAVSYRVVCEEDGQKQTSEVAAKFTSDTVDFRMQFQLDPKARPNTMRIVGKRVGACKG